MILTLKVVGNCGLLRVSSIRSEITSFPSQSEADFPTLEQKRALNGCRYLVSCFWIVRPHFSSHRSTSIVSYVLLPPPPPIVLFPKQMLLLDTSPTKISRYPSRVMDNLWLGLYFGLVICYIKDHYKELTFI